MSWLEFPKLGGFYATLPLPGPGITIAQCKKLCTDVNVSNPNT